MGSFYTNFTVKHGDVQDIALVLGRANRTAILTPSRNGYVVIYDQGCEVQDPEEMELVGALLSKALRTPVIGVMNHDDGVLFTWLFDNGVVLDSYNSCPAYFGEDDTEEPTGGDAKLLCDAFSPQSDFAEVEGILREAEGYVFASERHQALVDALGLSGAAVHTGYRYIEQDEGPDEFDPSELIRVG